MSKAGTLYHLESQRQSKIILATAALVGVDFDFPSDYTHHESNKKPEFTSKFPLGQVPAFEGTDGFTLAEGLPIARYIASLAPNSQILGADKHAQASVDQWIHYVETEIQPIQSVYAGYVTGRLGPFNKPTATNFLERHITALTPLEAYLHTRTFLVGERITLADLTLAGTIQRANETLLGADERKKFPAIQRHFETIVNTPKIKAIWRTTEYTEKTVTFVPPPKEKKEKAPAPAAAPAAPKAEKKAKPKDDDEDDDLVPAEPKAKNPLDDLPKSNFNLEDWKRTYSNNDTRGAGGALEWFYANFDKSGFSTWRVDFKYNEDLTQTFMSSNQITGFFNRLEGSRKYLFGSVGVLGTANASIITGALILRGPDVQKVVEVAPDWESYTYKALDLENADDKAFFEAALAWDLEVDGKKWADGKNFK